MAIPQWRDVSANFAGSTGSMANAQRGFANAGRLASAFTSDIAERERAARTAERQAVLQGREDALWNRQQQEQQASDLYRSERAKGPNVVDGILTDTMKPSEVDLMAYTADEMKATEGINYTDTADLRRKLLEAGSSPELVESIVQKTERQMGLSDLADTLPGRREVQETNLQQLERIASQMQAQGMTPSDAMLDRIESARTAEMTVAQKKQEDAAAEVAKIREELAKLPMEMAKLKDAADKELFGTKKTGSGGGFDVVEDYQKAADKLNNYVDGLYGGSKGDPRVKQEQVNAAQTMLQQLVQGEGLHPSLARGVVEQSFRKEPGKKGSWYFLGLNSRDPVNDTDIVRFNNALARAKQLQQGIVSGGYSTADVGVDPNPRQRQVLEATETQLRQRLAAAQAKQELAEMTPEQRQRAQMRSILNEAGVTTAADRSVVQQPDKQAEPRGKRTVGGDLDTDRTRDVAPDTTPARSDVFDEVTPEQQMQAEKQSLIEGTRVQFDALYNKPNKTEEDWTTLQELGRELDQLTGRVSVYEPDTANIDKRLRQLRGKQITRTITPEEVQELNNLLSAKDAVSPRRAIADFFSGVSTPAENRFQELLSKPNKTRRELWELQDLARQFGVQLTDRELLLK